jgi:REP element-mobilizing transposase RayT
VGVSADSKNPGLDRVRHELRATGVKVGTANPLRSGVHSRGYLPHVKREGAEYFVTFRLADSLPKEVLLRYEAERTARLRAGLEARHLGRPIADTDEIVGRDFRRAVERYLDQGAGACHLRRPEMADLVAGAVTYFHEQRYLLREWVVMPNHVHVLLWPMPNHLLGDIVKSWKQFTSLRAKRRLGLPEGRFWQPESFEHWVRADEERARIAKYIRHNPVTARLCAQPEDWRWSSAWRGKTESRVEAGAS